MKERQRNAKRSDQEWIDLIQECRTSGLGDKEWCELHEIPISSFYTKISRLRRKACDIPKAQHRVIREAQQVVLLPIMDEVAEVFRSEHPLVGNETPAVVLKINDYCIEISNHAAQNTILNTLSVLQQLCQGIIRSCKNLYHHRLILTIFLSSSFLITVIFLCL